MTARPALESTTLASEFPPGLKDFNFKVLWEFQLLGINFEITKLTVLLWVSVLALVVFFSLAVRNQKMVPGRLQFAGESAYGFVRDGMAKPMMGEEGVRFAPYLTTLFCFIIVSNWWAIIPVVQIPTTAKISLPVVLALISYVLFNWVGIRKHGVKKYFGGIFWPAGAPWWILWLLTPIEIISTLIARPVTLAVRLFANMFAGHMLLLVFTFGGVALLNSDNFVNKTFSIFSFGMAIVMTIFEFMVQIIQAYVFTILTASYLQGALAEEH
ncbi:MAG: F0F1 ATP synthase subunit A [Corynebacteriales bacterium]|nr:F0F1 ATP synthase subunit A [Mycobacteriales bacterium]